MGKVVLIESDRMGPGNEELGRVLMKNFLYSLARAAVKPAMVFFVNDGVRLACDGSDSLDDLFLLVEEGVPVLACGTCLDYLQLADALRVGAVGRMPDLVVHMMDAEDVLTVV
jgi:selenium metabolism protein YedF